MMREDGLESRRQKGNLRQMVRALRGRNYVLFFVGHGVSLIGTWMIERGLAPAPCRLRIEYRVPALLGDVVRIASWAVGDDVQYALTRQSDGELLARAVGSWRWTDSETGEGVEIAK